MLSPSADRRHFTVVCALITEKGKLLVAQRPPGKSLGLKWEFPGGKIEAGESAADALRREIREELGIEIAIGRAFTPVTHDYETVTITLVPFAATILDGATPKPTEHVALRWCEPHELPLLDWAEADIPVFREWLSVTDT